MNGSGEYHSVVLDAKEVAYLHEKTSLFFDETDKENVQMYGRVWSFTLTEWTKVNREFSEVEIAEEIIGEFPVELSLLVQMFGVLNKLWIKHWTQKQ